MRCVPDDGDMGASPKEGHVVFGYVCTRTDELIDMKL